MNPGIYFKINSFVESLLISYFFDIQNEESEIVFADINNQIRYTREFVQWTFFNISNFKRVLGWNEELKRFVSEYDARSTTHADVIQECNFSKAGEKLFSLEIWFGYSFGGLQFDFESFKEKRRLGVGRKDEFSDDYVYHDYYTQKKFDFYLPFRS